MSNQTEQEIFEIVLQKLWKAKNIDPGRPPLMGSKQLDLFKLYTAVNSRGGLDEVTEQHSWKSVGAEFDLPSSCTNSSYLLKKNYLNFLLDFEILFKGKIPGPDVDVDELISQK